MATAYLTAHPPVRDQWYSSRNRRLTGCTVLHTAESAFDEMGEDTGAEGVANFIRTRTTPGSYHDLVDSDSAIYLVDYKHGAYHDGTGSNNWALSLSFACRTSDWRRMTAAKREAMLRNGAKAFARQQAWRKANGYPLTELRLISKAQSDAGQSGFTYHGYRDPGRRTDPGVTAPDLFPLTEFLTYCREELAGGTPEEDDEMPSADEVADKVIEKLRNADWSPAKGVQSNSNLTSQTNTMLKDLMTRPWRRFSPTVAAPEGEELAPSTIAGLVRYIDANVRRILEALDKHAEADQPDEPPAEQPQA